MNKIIFPLLFVSLLMTYCEKEEEPEKDIIVGKWEVNNVFLISIDTTLPFTSPLGNCRWQAATISALTTSFWEYLIFDENGNWWNGDQADGFYGTWESLGDSLYSLTEQVFWFPRVKKRMKQYLIKNFKFTFQGLKVIIIYFLPAALVSGFH